MRHKRKSKAEFFQDAAEEFMRLNNLTEFDPDEVAAWMVETNQFQETYYSVQRQCKKELTKALKAKRVIDPQGRDVRGMLSVRKRNAQGELFSTWAPLFRSKPTHARLSLQQWRRSFKGEALLHHRTTASYNENNIHGAAIPLFDYDLNKDIAENEMPKEYPEDRPPEDQPPVAE